MSSRSKCLSRYKTSNGQKQAVLRDGNVSITGYFKHYSSGGPGRVHTGTKIVNVYVV